VLREVSYEISIGSSILFDGFGGMDRPVTVCGIKCPSRLEAPQRIFEHELVHLAEQLCWGNSNCAAERFQAIAARFFLHQVHTHNLITRRERAEELGIRIGSLVTFNYEGRQLMGRVNRITKTCYGARGGSERRSILGRLEVQDLLRAPCMPDVRDSAPGEVKFLNPVHGNRFSGKRSPTELSNRLWAVCVRMVRYWNLDNLRCSTK
jgi:hypothetical protein